MEAIVAAAFDIGGIDMICAQKACDNDHGARSDACNAAGLGKYLEDCQQMMTNLGVKRIPVKLPAMDRKMLKERVKGLKEKYETDSAFKTKSYADAMKMMENMNKSEDGDDVEEARNHRNEL
ncbi:hypothetical protein K504DRAFT_536315 [Pleomassaria siparia CBS 279.74]|uniref:Uncharacterized protein n=1 Tax=Pleomassaria siparia CBS 279.74 TaxID=1314801 RepID=A0A6G1K290_9PLEO|nr:hypothetical protein K504DRAFT_536315 [Pleomassaria siparia CBS 279.74]